MTENVKKPLEIEAQLKKLESIVELLEKGELSLEESLSLYEEGIALTKACHTTLQQAEKTIENLANNPATVPETNKETKNDNPKEEWTESDDIPF